MTVEVGKECAAAFLALGHSERPDAVLIDDALAFGFMDGLPDQTRVPSELSLLGFDNIAASAWLLYQLTTFEQPLDDMVGRIVDYINLHQKKQPDTFHSTIPHRIGEDGVVHCQPNIIGRTTTKSLPLKVSITSS